MQLYIEMKNIGKIKHAEVEIKPLTVLAGKNNSGKSFVTKTFYSFLNAINENHFVINIGQYVDSLALQFIGVISNIKYHSKNDTGSFDKIFNQLNKLRHCPYGSGKEEIIAFRNGLV